MDNFEQINQRLVEISDSIKQHRTEWQSVVKEASLSQQIAIKRARWFWIWIGILILMVWYGPSLLNSLPLHSRHTSFNENTIMTYIGHPADTQIYDGQYLIDSECLNTILSKNTNSRDRQEDADIRFMQELIRDQLSTLSINQGIIRMGKDFIQEYRIRGEINRSNEFVGGALWCEDIRDPGDACIVNVKLKLENNKLSFYYSPLGCDFDQPLVFIKK